MQPSSSHSQEVPCEQNLSQGSPGAGSASHVGGDGVGLHMESGSHQAGPPVKASKVVVLSIVRVEPGAKTRSGQVSIRLVHPSVLGMAPHSTARWQKATR